MIDGYQGETSVSHRRGRVNRLTNLKIEMPLFFREMKKVISRKLLEMQERGVKRVAFFGVSDEMEIAYLILQGTDMELVAILDGDDGVRPQTVLGRKAGNPVIIENLKADAILITSIRAKDEILRNANRIMRRNNKIKLFTIT
jgi:hypothetical protein